MTPRQYAVRRLSRRIEWLPDAPPSPLPAGLLLYRIEFANRKVWPDGTPRDTAYAVVRGAPSRRSWWACYLLNNTDAKRVTEVV